MQMTRRWIKTAKCCSVISFIGRAHLQVVSHLNSVDVEFANFNTESFYVLQLSNATQEILMLNVTYNPARRFSIDTKSILVRWLISFYRFPCLIALIFSTHGNNSCSRFYWQHVFGFAGFAKYFPSFIDKLPTWLWFCCKFRNVSNGERSTYCSFKNVCQSPLFSEHVFRVKYNVLQKFTTFTWWKFINKRQLLQKSQVCI